MDKTPPPEKPFNFKRALLNNVRPHSMLMAEEEATIKRQEESLARLKRNQPILDRLTAARKKRNR